MNQEFIEIESELMGIPMDAWRDDLLSMAAAFIREAREMPLIFEMDRLDGAAAAVLCELEQRCVMVARYREPLVAFLLTKEAA